MSGVYDPNTGELLGGLLAFPLGGFDRLAQYTPEERELLRVNGEFWRTEPDGRKRLIRAGDDYAGTVWNGDVRP